MIDTTDISDMLRSESSGVWKWNLDTGYVEFNEEWKKVLGFSSGEINHDVNFWLDLLHPDESVNIMHEVFRCRDGVIPVFRATHRLRKKDNSWITVLSIGTDIKTSKNNETSYFLCNQFLVDDDVHSQDYLHSQRDLDIIPSSTIDLSTTVHKSLEGVLKFYDAETDCIYLLDHDTDTFKLIENAGLPDWFIEKHRILMDRIEIPILAVDRNIRILFSNNELTNILDDKSIEGKLISNVFPGKLAKVLIDEFGEVLETGKPRQVLVEYKKRTWNIAFSSIPDGVLATMQDITSSEIANVRLDFKSKFETLLINISTGFIEMQGNALNLGINDALMEIGIAINADRSYLFQLNSKDRTVSNTHEWCATNIEPRIDILKDIPMSRISRRIRKLNRHEPIFIPSVADLQEEDLFEKHILEEQNIQSLLEIPIIHADDLIGFLGFDSVRRKRTWSADIINLLRMAGDAMGNALERNRMEIKRRNMYHEANEEARMNAVLLREVNHRVKNNLSEIIGLLYAQMRYTDKSKSISDFVPSLIGRVQALATVHSILSNSGWKPLKICELARQIISNTISIRAGGQRVFSTVPDSDVKVNSNQAHSLALIFNELVRNSIKYAYKDIEHPMITMKIHQDNTGIIIINYRDNGSGFPDEILERKRSGLGIDIIDNVVSKNLQGKLTMLNDKGAMTEISFIDTT